MPMPLRQLLAAFLAVGILGARAIVADVRPALADDSNRVSSGINQRDIPSGPVPLSTSHDQPPSTAPRAPGRRATFVLEASPGQTSSELPGLSTLVPSYSSSTISSEDRTSSMTLVATSSSDTASLQALPDRTAASSLSSVSIRTRQITGVTSSGAGLKETNFSVASDDGSNGNNRALVITLSSVLSVVGLLLILGAIYIYLRYRRSRKPFFARGITPIGDDEIATWKLDRKDEKDEEAGVTTASSADSTPRRPRLESTASSTRKPPSVIVYQNQAQHPASRPSTATRHDEQQSPRYFMSGGGKQSMELPQAPVLAKAPNSRAGLTDEALPGDDPFLPSPKRRPSRLSKLPSSRAAHMRTRSSKSSVSVGSLGDMWYGSPPELSPRTSSDVHHHHAHAHPHNHHNHMNNTGYRPNSHSRVYSSSSIPPRISIDEELLGGLSPRPMFRDGDIGRAIG